VRFLEKTPLGLAEAEQAIDVGGIAVAPEAVLAVRLAVHRFWVARIADGNLCAVPCDGVDVKVAMDEVDYRT
jgi:uncharacterized lipoprotein NlpE involved in copper resistance